MKKLLIKILLFISPIIILAYPLDLFLSYTLKKGIDYSGEIEVWNDIYNGKANVDIAIYGSSRAWLHINPAIIEDILQKTAYNFGVDGHNFWLQYLRHLEYIYYNEQQPSTIIYSVDMFTLQKRYDLYNLEQFLPYMFWNESIYKYTNSYEGYDKHDYFVPLIRYAGKYEKIISSLATGFSKHPRLIRYKGFAGQDKEWNDDFERAKAKNNNYQAKLDDESIVLFENFIKECKNDNIDLVLVYTPEYIEGQKYIENRSEVMSIYDNLAQKYDLLFLDYSNDEISFDRSLFYNTSHLNKTGANLFTTKLAHDLKMRMHNQ